MLRKIVWFGALLALLVQGSSQCQQNSPSPLAAPPDAARFRAEIQRVEDALPKIPDRGAALFMLARRYARLGELQNALTLLKECIALHEGFDPADRREFEPLRGQPEFLELVDEVHRQYPAVRRATVAFTIQETDLFPEGLAADAAKHLFYMGSMHRKKIIKITDRGEVSDFVRPDLYDLMPVGGIKVDAADHSVWAATDPGEANRSELVHFDENGKLLERYPAPGPGPHDLNDLVLRKNREIFLSDTFAHQAYRFDRISHAFTPLAFPRPLFYPNGITVSGNKDLLYLADSMGVIAVDLRNNEVHEVDPGKRSTLAGIDGLYWYKGDLLGVQYGTGAFRVARFRLSQDGLHVRQTEILEYRTPLVSFPTTGAIAREKFYFIANTGIGNLQDDKIVDTAKLEPVHIAVVSLRDH